MTLPYPLSAPARELTPAEESAKKAFQEMHWRRSVPEQSRKAPQ